MRRWFRRHPEESTKSALQTHPRRDPSRATSRGVPGLRTGTLARIESAQPRPHDPSSRRHRRALPSTRRPDFPTRARFRASWPAWARLPPCRCCSRAMMVNHAQGHDRLRLFQPAEELGLGARAMIKEAARSRASTPAPGMHVWSDYPAGTVALRKGPMMASGDQFKIHVRGKSTHGAQPQAAGADALHGRRHRAGEPADNHLPRHPGDTAVVTVGQFHSGTRFNVVAGARRTRGHDPQLQPRQVRDRFEEQITRIARSTAEAMRARRCRIPGPSCPSRSFWAMIRASSRARQAKSSATSRHRGRPADGRRTSPSNQEKVPGAMVSACARRGPTTPSGRERPTVATRSTSPSSSRAPRFTFRPR